MTNGNGWSRGTSLAAVILGAITIAGSLGGIYASLSSRIDVNSREIEDLRGDMNQRSGMFTEYVKKSENYDAEVRQRLERMNDTILHACMTTSPRHGDYMDYDRAYKYPK
jgi:hypothetical protein